MQKISRIALAASSLLALTGPAFAADPYDRGSLKDGGYEAQPTRNWSGLWLGALGGYQIANDKLKANEEWHCEDYAYSNGVSLDGLGQQGLFGEIQVGYDRQVSERLVAGVFGGLNISGGKFSVDASASETIHGVTNSEGVNLLSFEQKWGGVIGPRLGYLTSPSTMFYVAGGWAFGELGKVKSDGKDVFTKANGFSHDQETSLSGVFGEVGMETQLTGDLYLKVAGRYTKYSAIDLVSESTGDVTEGASVHATLDHDALAGMVGLTYKFGR